MAKQPGQDPNEVLRKTHRTARSDVLLFFLPILAMPIAVYLINALNKRFEAADGEPLATWWYFVAIGVLALFPIWAWIKAVTNTRYKITLSSVVAEIGFVSKESREIRIRDIRNINVRQSVLDRILFIGNVEFSSAAGDAVEVKFAKVSQPAKVREFVKKLQHMLDDGVIDEDERAELDVMIGKKKKKEAAPAAPSSGGSSEPAPAAPSASDSTASAPTPAQSSSSSSSGSDDDRDELYRLLAEQEADAKSE